MTARILRGSRRTHLQRMTIAASLFLVFSQHGASAQRQILLHPADGSDLWLSSRNPAALSFQHSRLVVGTEILHATFVPERAFGLNEHRLHLAFPYWLPLNLAFGFEVRSFNALIYSEIEADLLLSKKISSQLALGMKLGVEDRSFDRSQFTLVDPNDPLLQGNSLRRNTPNLGLGLYWNKGALAAGASVQHLYRPNLAFATQALQPRFMALGLAYNLGLFAPGVTWNDNGSQQLFGLNLTANISKLAVVRLGYERSGPVRLETQFHFHRDGKLAYGVNVPAGAIGAASNGTHALAYEHTLGREPEIGAPLLSLSTSRMNVMIERHKRIAEAGVPLEALRALPGMAKEYVDPREQLGNLVVLPLVETEEEAFKALCQNAAFLLQEHALSNLALRVAPGARNEARVFEKMLQKEMNGNKARVLVGYQKPEGAVALEEFRSGRTVVVEQAPVLSHEKVVIDIVVPSQRRHVQEWRLDLLAPNAAPVKRFHGTGTLPVALEWDWRNEAGELVPAGQYRCALALKSATGKKYTATAELEVTVTRREVTLRLAKSQKAEMQQSARINMETR